jgi:hypothetical protein
MNQQAKVKIETTLVDRLQDEERRYYVMLQQYAKAVRSGSSPDALERFKTELCDAFAALKAAQERIGVNCDDLPDAANK